MRKRKKEMNLEDEEKERKRRKSWVDEDEKYERRRSGRRKDIPTNRQYEKN